MSENWSEEADRLPIPDAEKDIDEESAALLGAFDIRCKQCGAVNRTRLESYSCGGESGGDFELSVVCKACGAYVIVYENSW